MSPVPWHCGHTIKPFALHLAQGSVTSIDCGNPRSNNSILLCGIPHKVGFTIDSPRPK